MGQPNLVEIFPPLRQSDLRQGVEITLGGRKYLHFCGEDFLGYGQDKRIERAAVEGLSREGAVASACPDAAGHRSSHARLCKKLASFIGTEDALLFSGRGQALFGLLSTCVYTGDRVLVDSLTKRTIFDYFRGLPCAVQTYNHGDLKELESQLLGTPGKAYVVTESIFSQSGELAPLSALLEAIGGAQLIVDETQALGAFGLIGSGALEKAGLVGKGVISLFSFHATLGSFGTALCANKQICDSIRNYSPSFAEEPCLPAPCVYATEKALELLQTDAKGRAHLRANALKLKAGLDTMGISYRGHSDSPLKMLAPEDSNLGVELVRGLFERGFLVLPLFGYRPQGELIGVRLSVSASHKDEQINSLLQALEDVSKLLGIL